MNEYNKTITALVRAQAHEDAAEIVARQAQLDLENAISETDRLQELFNLLIAERGYAVAV